MYVCMYVCTFSVNNLYCHVFQISTRQNCQGKQPQLLTFAAYEWRGSEGRTEGGGEGGRVSRESEGGEGEQRDQKFALPCQQEEALTCQQGYKFLLLDNSNLSDLLDLLVTKLVQSIIRNIQHVQPIIITYQNTLCREAGEKNLLVNWAKPFICTGTKHKY